MKKLRHILYPLAWLIYLIVPVYALIEKHSFGQTWMGLVAIAAFILFYVLSFTGERIRFVYVLLQCLITGFLIFQYGLFFIQMFIYPIVISGNYRSPKYTYCLYGILAVTCTFLYLTIDTIQLDANFLINGCLFLLLIIVFPLAIRWQVYYSEIETELEEANDKIKQLIKKEERERIAQDLHDTLGHTLSMISLKSDLATKFMDRDQDQAKSEIKEIHNTARSALREIREIVSSMKMTSWNEEFSSANRLIEAAGITFHSKCEETFNLTPFKENILSLCLRECVNNVVKHSGAKNCRVHLINNDGKLTLWIQDDGSGFTNAGHSIDGTGLKGLKERLQLVNGLLDYETSSKGTKITIIMPITQRGAMGVVE